MLYFGILDFSQRKESNTLKKAFDAATYERFKKQFTAKIKLDAAAGNICKNFLVKLGDADNKKDVIKKEKEAVLQKQDNQ